MGLNILAKEEKENPLGFDLNNPTVQAKDVIKDGIIFGIIGFGVKKIMDWGEDVFDELD